MSSMYITKVRPEPFKVNILGTEYTVVFKSKEEDVKLLQCDGYCDNTINTIIIAWLEWDAMNHNDMINYTNKVIRHEIVHAYLYQSGLDINSVEQWARNEEMVDWIAIQLYKIHNTCMKANIDFEIYKDQVVTEEDVK